MEEDACKKAEQNAQILAEAHKKAKLKADANAYQLKEIEETMSVEIVKDGTEGSMGESLILEATHIWVEQETAGGPAVKLPAAVEIPGKICQGCIEHKAVCKWEVGAISQVSSECFITWLILT